jgi:hypothetical protein
MSFPPGTEMVHFPRFASRLAPGYPDITRDGLPHSGIPGSKPAYGSPRLIAVRHALHRLSVPRHPPYTLKTLINKFNKLYLPDKPNTATSIEKSKNSLYKNKLPFKHADNLENTGIEPVAFGVQNRRSPN